MNPHYSPDAGIARLDELMYSFPDRWDRPWNSFAFLCLVAFAWVVYGFKGNVLRFDWLCVILAVGTGVAFWDILDTVKIPTKVSFPDERIESQRLFLPAITWVRSEVEVQEKAGGLIIINKRSPEKPRCLNTIVLPRDYPRLDEIRDVLTEPYPAQKIHPPDLGGSMGAGTDDLGGPED